jgi:ribosomal-protein-alanine N-acetyltransferase
MHTPLPRQTTASATVRLRQINATDETAFMQGLRDSRDLLKPWVQVPQSRKTFQKYVVEMNTADDRAWAVLRRDTRELAGVVELRDIFYGDFKNAYLIYYAFQAHQKQGLMKQAIQQVIAVAFNRLKLHRLEANIQPDNLASIALLKSCGFNKEGFSPRFLKKNGQWRDHERWAMLADSANNLALDKSRTVESKNQPLR